MRPSGVRRQASGASDHESRVTSHVSRSAGFTLIELVITLAIVGLLASVAMPLASIATQRNKEQELRTALRTIREGIDAYKRAFDEGRIARKAEQSGFPPTLETLADGVLDARDPKGGKIYFLRRVPRDPFTRAGEAPAWGLRSYDSTHEAPQPGRDVFDVYSLNQGTGLNGVRYRDW
jgi:general secretion pathway protein G